MRSVLFKLLAKAAMRLRNERLQAAGMAIRIRFVGMERRYEKVHHGLPGKAALIFRKKYSLSR